jgi:hypothetical protein
LQYVELFYYDICYHYSEKLGFEFRASCLVGRWFTTSAKTPADFLLYLFFSERIIITDMIAMAGELDLGVSLKI